MKRLLQLMGAVIVLMMVPMFTAATHVLVASWGRVTTLAEVEPHETAMVLGARVTAEGPSEALAVRLDLAARLQREGKVEEILVTGNGSDSAHDEPAGMKRYLVEHHGIPADIIIEDPGGLDTYDSCVRAKNEYDVDSLIAVTHDYHIRRVITLCEAVGIETVGVADGQMRHRSTELWLRGAVREPFANLKMEWDLLSERPPAIEGP